MNLMNDEKWRELTDMELKTLKLIHEGLTRALICVRLNRAKSTVDTYIYNIYDKLETTGFVKAALYYERNII